MKHLLSKCALAGAALAAVLLAPQAKAVNLASDGIGELAIVPYYTVREGWLTLINMTNTGIHPILVKLRIKEGLNGRDVRNFTVALAGHDSFTGVIREGQNGPVFVATDHADQDGRRTCTIPNNIADPDTETLLSTAAFGPPGSENDDGGPSGNDSEAVDRLREGRIEMIVQGYAEGQDMGINGGGLMRIGDAIESFNCAALESALSNATTDGERNTLIAARQFGEPVNVLKVNYGLLNPQRGTEVGGAATTWANFYKRNDQPRAAVIEPQENADCDYARDFMNNNEYTWYPDGSFNSCRNLVAAQVFPNALEPSLEDVFPPIAHWWEGNGDYPVHAQSTRERTRLAEPPNGEVTTLLPVIEAPSAIDALSLTIQRRAVINEWSTNARLGASTDWIVTFPTKGFYVDGGSGAGNLGPGHYSALSPGRNGKYLEQTPGNEPFPPFTQSNTGFGQSSAGDRSTAGACTSNESFRYDRKTVRLDDGPIVAADDTPPQAAMVRLCAETNIISFNGDSALHSTHAHNIDFDYGADTGTKAGWMALRLGIMDGDRIEARQTAGPFMGEISEYVGLPVIGLRIKQRSFGDVRRNFASSVDHQYQSEINPIQP